MLLALLKSVVRWVFDALVNNRLADVEELAYFGEKIDESNEG